MPNGLRRLLHRTVDFVRDSRHAERKARGHAMYTIGQCKPLHAIRKTGTSGGLRKVEAQRGDVRRIARRSAGFFARTRNG
jgi:hypothetical protein